MTDQKHLQSRVYCQSWQPENGSRLTYVTADTSIKLELSMWPILRTVRCWVKEQWNSTLSMHPRKHSPNLSGMSHQYRLEEKASGICFWYLSRLTNGTNGSGKEMTQSDHFLPLHVYVCYKTIYSLCERIGVINVCTCIRLNNNFVLYV